MANTHVYPHIPLSAIMTWCSHDDLKFKYERGTHSRHDTNNRARQVAVEGALGLEHLLLAYTMLDWLQSLKQLFINVSYHIFVASLTLMALF